MLAVLANYNYMNGYRWLCLSFFFGLFLHVLFNWWQWPQPVYSRQKSLFLISTISAFLFYCMHNYIKTKILKDFLIKKVYKLWEKHTVFHKLFGCSFTSHRVSRKYIMKQHQVSFRLITFFFNSPICVTKFCYMIRSLI